jgi:hypothetical protein
MKQKDKNDLINSIISLIVCSMILFAILSIKYEISRYNFVHTTINVKVLSTRIQTDNERSMGKFNRDVDNIYISFEYKDDIYSNFKLGEEDEYKNINSGDIINLDLCEEYEDGILKQTSIQP